MGLRGRLSRKAFCNVTAGTVLVLPRAAGAAPFEYKFAHGLPVESPNHVRVVQMWEAVKSETGGRLVVTTFPNSELASQNQIVPQVRLGAVQFCAYGGSAFSGLVGVAEIDSVAFAFSSSPQAWRVMDGPLGAYVRQQFIGAGMFCMPKKYESGMRQIGGTAQPVTTLNDLAGLKIEVPIARISTEFFQGLGASPAPVPSNEWYTALQTHLVGAVDCPVYVIESFKLYEVTRYLSLTNHMWNGVFTVANLAAWRALPADIQEIVLRNQAKFADLQRRDVAQSNASLVDKLKRRGIAVNVVVTPAGCRACGSARTTPTLKTSLELPPGACLRPARAN